MISPVLAVVFSLSESMLHVTYSVSNPGDQNIFLFATLWRFSINSGVMSDEFPLYVSLDPDGVLKLGKIIHPTPRLKFVEMANIPMARKVEPGAVWKETMDLPLPIHEHSPYYLPGPSSQWEDVRSQSVEFWISWIPSVNDLDVKPSLIEAALTVRHPQLFKLVQTLRSARESLNIPVRRRIDSFERF